jgi:SAM-dependent methyltransferase
MTSPFFGELYLRSTRPFLGDAVSEREAEYLARAFSEAGVQGPVVDLGCGHGRHAARLQGRLPGGGPVVGLDLDDLSFREREGGFPGVRADLRQMPFRDASLCGAFAWYSTLFVFEDAEQRRVLREVARCLRPGALLVVQTSPRERLERAPTAVYEGQLPDGSHLRERSRFDADSGRDIGVRELTTPDGRVLSAHYFIRYYRLPELAELLASEGFVVRWVHGGLDGQALDDDSADLIMGVARNG